MPKKEVRKIALKAMIKDITIQRNILLREQRAYKIELFELEEED